MNTALQDVWNLVWKLDLVLHGRGKEQLFESYSATAGHRTCGGFNIPKTFQCFSPNCSAGCASGPAAFQCFVPFKAGEELRAAFPNITF